ncbi:MAG: LysR family transcriptional regulator [Eggerthellaceae bacterium]|nr:LysR family transcriptional regulator [Eggerthellaceae bacterium]
MQIDSLRYFVELAEASSFYAAAERVHISHQGLNKAITALERELGVKLIDRGRSGIRLTQHGELLLSHANAILDEYRLLVDDMLKDTVGTPDAAKQLIVHSTYYPLQVAAGINGGELIQMHSIADEMPISALLDAAESSSGEELYIADMHPYHSDLYAQHSDLAFETVLRTRYGFVVREDSPFASKEVLHRDAVANRPVAVNSQHDMASYTRWLFREMPLKAVRLKATGPRMLLEFAQGSPDRLAAFDSFGFSIAETDPYMPTDGLVFVPVSTPESICEVGAVISRKHKPTIHIRYVIDALKRYLQESYPEHYARYPIQ